MLIIGDQTLEKFWKRHASAKKHLRAWRYEVRKAVWTRPTDVTDRYPKARAIGGNRVVFMIKGHDYRLVVKIDYRTGVVEIRFVGTHAEYDAINAREV